MVGSANNQKWPGGGVCPHAAPRDQNSPILTVRVFSCLHRRLETQRLKLAALAVEPGGENVAQPLTPVLGRKSSG